MAAPNNRQVHLESLAEFVFLLILIWMIAGPISGAVLSSETWVSSIFAKGAYQIQSTKNLATQLLQSSQRIKALEAKLAQAQLELTSLRQQSRDTNKLRTLLGLKQRLARQTIAADVIARNPDNWFEQVIIDKGRLDHVMKGSAVITNNGVVGQIVSVSDKASVVRLITDPDQKLGVVFERLGLTGILSGNYQSPARVDYIPVGTNIDIGDKILSLGKGGIFPENQPVGSVIRVVRDANGATLQIEVKLSENCYDLNQVLVITPLINS